MRLFFVPVLLFFMVGSAASESIRPDSLIDQATSDMLVIIDQARGYYDDEPERYFGEIEQVISPIIDFYGFSRGVMGKWGSRAYYKSLKTDAEREQFNAQVERFSVVFRRALVETYGKGLLAFGGERIEVKSVPDKEVASGSAYVVQLIHAENAPPHVIRYRMRRDEDGKWRMRNVILDEINLGVVYRNQFAAAVSRHSGEIDKVIDNWRITQ